MTTLRLEAMTSVTQSPTKAQPYCVASVPRLRVTPPAIANRTDGQLFGNCKCLKWNKSRNVNCRTELLN